MLLVTNVGFDAVEFLNEILFNESFSFLVDFVDFHFEMRENRSVIRDCDLRAIVFSQSHDRLLLSE